MLLEVPRVEQLFQRLSAAPLRSGAELRGELLSSPMGDILSVRDPAGNRIDFLSALDARRGGVV